VVINVHLYHLVLFSAAFVALCALSTFALRIKALALTPFAAPAIIPALHSAWLFSGDMEVSQFIQRNPDEQRTVTSAKSEAERADILRKRFLFDVSKVPKVGQPPRCSSAFHVGVGMLIGSDNRCASKCLTMMQSPLNFCVVRRLSTRTFCCRGPVT
jgi:hypothetical protein